MSKKFFSLFFATKTLCATRVLKTVRPSFRWGFSPWSELPGSRVLIVGAGDPRHLLFNLAPVDSPDNLSDSSRGDQEVGKEDVGDREMLKTQENKDQQDESLNVKDGSTACKRRRREGGEQREILLLEQNMETYCRQLLLHRIATHPDLDISERTEIFIDLFANIRIKPESGRVARAEASQLAKEVAQRKGLLVDCWSLELLRQREID